MYKAFENIHDITIKGKENLGCQGLTSESPHMGHRHPEYRQFVRFPREGRTRGYHVREFGDVGGHLVPPPPFDFAMILPAVSRKTKPR